MSETYFAVRNSQTPIKGGKRTAAKMDKIAKSVNPQAGYTYYLESATGLYRGWGFGPNRGMPFDDRLAADVQSAWRDAGIDLDA